MTDWRIPLTGQLSDQSSVDRRAPSVDTMATKSEEQKKQSWFQKTKTAVVHRMFKGEEAEVDIQKVVKI